LPDSTVNKVVLTLDSTLDSVDQAEATAEQQAARAGIPEDDRYQISMAVREATVNAVMHGNAYDPDKKVTVSFENDGTSLIIRIADQGEGVDLDHLPDPLAPENILRGSGRGIFLIRSFMDEVQFRKLDPGTELTLIKRLPSPPMRA
jgi:serine/threonine-protein kinase RsbW